MEDFLEFYTYGGFFNHIVSLFALAGIVFVVQHAASARQAIGDGRLLGMVDRLAGLAVAAGLLGVVFNYIELGNALATVDAEVFLQASQRGASIVPIPLGWALMCAIPLWLTSAVLRQRMPASAH